jgi:hypothetical protein
MKKLIILILVTVLLQSCRICCNGEPKHYNARNLTDRVFVDTLGAPCIDVPEIVVLTDIVGKPVDKLNDGVYIVVLSNNERVIIVN